MTRIFIITGYDTPTITKECPGFVEGGYCRQLITYKSNIAPVVGDMIRDPTVKNDLCRYLKVYRIRREFETKRFLFFWKRTIEIIDVDVK